MLSEPEISAKRIGEMVGSASHNIEVDIRFLKDSGLVERIGSPRNGYWVVKEYDN